MRFGLLLTGVALAALLACSKPGATTTTSSVTATVAASASVSAAYAPLTVAGLNVSCNAEHESVCDDKGCRAQTDGMTHVALSYEGATAAGDFCIGETCSAMTLAAMPSAGALQPDEDVTGAIVITRGPETFPPISAPFFDGVVVIKRDGSSFRLFRGDQSVWTGACTPAHRPDGADD